MVAAMTEALRLQGGENVLEIGTGSGYAAAVLAHIVREVHTIERIPVLADHARATLRRLGYHTVHVVEGDGTLGWPAGAPYDAIVGSANARVWIARPDSKTVVSRDITVGNTINGLVEVRKGLAIGETVVISGTLFIDRAARRD